MFFGTLGASLSGNLVTGKEVARLVSSNKQGVMRQGVMRAAGGTLRAG